MVPIKLTKGYTCYVDEADAQALSELSWCASDSGNGIVYAVTTIARKKVFLHRHILLAPRGLFVDHADGDTMNNTRANLRLCTRLENNRNRRGRTTLNGYKGITQRKKSGLWVAQIGLDGSTKYIGSFKDPGDAARAYDQAAIALFGEYAYTNKKESRE